MTKEEIVKKMWFGHSFIRTDELRWHNSGYHGIDKINPVNINNFVEEAFATLDTMGDETERCGVPISENEWYEKYVEDEEMLNAMCKIKFEDLKSNGGHFNFEPPEDGNWIKFYQG